MRGSARTSDINKLKDDVADLLIDSLTRRESEARKRRKEQAAKDAEQAAQAVLREEQARKPDHKVMSFANTV
jgi:hypothetical protein